jgi:hypothetical protein
VDFTRWKRNERLSESWIKASKIHGLQC